MSCTESLSQLLAKAYLQRAASQASRQHWAAAQADISRASLLRPLDHQPALMLARIWLQRGDVAQCCHSLAVARRLGHDAAANDQMLAWLRRRERRRIVYRTAQARVQHALNATGRGITSGLRPLLLPDSYRDFIVLFSVVVAVCLTALIVLAASG